MAGETPGALRELSVSLNRVGDGPREAGEPAAAHEVYNEALALDRWRIDLYGETPLAQRGLSVSLRKVAEIEEDLRNAAKAKAARAEAQSIAERLGS